jgi:hypothetical protein
VRVYRQLWNKRPFRFQSEKKTKIKKTSFRTRQVTAQSWLLQLRQHEINRSNSEMSLLNRFRNNLWPSGLIVFIVMSIWTPVTCGALDKLLSSKSTLQFCKRVVFINSQTLSDLAIPPTFGATT